MCTGKRSGITIIDLDGDYEWFNEFATKHDLPPTATVKTPSGGFHFYYQYEPRLGNVSTDGRSNANRHGDEHKIMVDCRNDNGLAIFPGSVYAIHPDLKA